MSGELVEMLITAETNGTESKDEVLKEDRFADANRERCIKTSREMYSVLARYTSSEASTIVKSVTFDNGQGNGVKGDGKGSGYKGAGKHGRLTCSHCGKAGHGPNNCWT